MGQVTNPRPSLRLVAPHTYYSSWTFALLNVFGLAPAFFLGSGKDMVLIGLIPSKLWGVIFLAIGSLMGYFLFTNNWKGIRKMLLVGLAIKAMIAWGLLFILAASILNIGIVAIWFSLMSWQAISYIFFTPEVKNVSF